MYFSTWKCILVTGIVVEGASSYKKNLAFSEFWARWKKFSSTAHVYCFYQSPLTPYTSGKGKGKGCLALPMYRQVTREFTNTSTPCKKSQEEMNLLNSRLKHYIAAVPIMPKQFLFMNIRKDTELEELVLRRLETVCGSKTKGIQIHVFQVRMQFISFLMDKKWPGDEGKKTWKYSLFLDLD